MGSVEAIPYNRDVLCGLRRKWRGVKETEWCAFAMERQEDWLPVLGKSRFDRYELEYQVSLRNRGERSNGLPRIDAVGWRHGKATLIEAKVDVSPSSMLGGVGQLLYYAEATRRLLSWDIEELVLMAPAWPLFLVETIDRNALPISLVQVTPDDVYGKRSVGRP